MSFLKTLLATTLGVFIALFVFGVLAVGLIVAIAASATSSGGSVHVPNNAVLRVKFDGAIPERTPDRHFSGIFDDEVHLSLREYLEGFDRAVADKRVSGLLLELDRFGGSWAQAEEIRNKILEVRRSGKFVYATGGVRGYNERDYFIATAADSVILHPAAEVEINGIYATLTFFKPAMDRLGIEANVVRAGAYKSAVEPFINETASPQNLEMTQSMVTDMFDTFKAAVRDARKLSAAQLDTILDRHALLTAEEARRLKIVDAVMYDDQIDELILHRTNRKAEEKRPTVDFDDYARFDDKDQEDRGGEIAVVYAEGSIISGESGYSPEPMFGGSQIGSKTFIDAIREARDSKSVKAIVLRVNSPGGSADASSAMWREVKLAAAKKPVIVSMGSLAASGGYYIASAGDTIVADPGTLTGSIGVFGLWFNMQKLYKNTLGINMQTVKSSPNADMMSSAEPPTDLERAILAKQVDTVYSHFLQVVSEGRHMPIDSVRMIAEGRVWTGRQAKARGLVDELGGIERAIEIAAARVGLKKGSYDVRELPREDNFLRLAQRFIRTRASLLFGGPTAVEALQGTIESLERRRGVQARMIDVAVN